MTGDARAPGGAAAHVERLHRVAYELTESIPVGTYTMVLPPGGGMGRFSFMSTRFLELTGLDREAVAADPFRAFACVHPDDYDAWVRKNAEVFAGKLPFHGECRIIVEGQVRWISAESTPRDLPDGSTVWEGVLIDVTERKRAEAALVSANRHMQLAAEAAGLGFWEYDVAAGTDTWDDQMLRIHGVPRAEFNGRWDTFLHPDDRDVVLRATEAILGAETVFALDYRIVRPDGAVRHVHQHGVVIRDADDRAVRVAGGSRNRRGGRHGGARGGRFGARLVGRGAGGDAADHHQAGRHRRGPVRRAHGDREPRRFRGVRHRAARRRGGSLPAAPRADAGH